MMLGIMMAACSNDGDAVVEEVVPAGEENQRPMTDIEVSVSLDEETDTRVVATHENGNNGLTLSWSEKERLGVYIRKPDNTILRAGWISSVGQAGRGTRSFTGKVSAKQAGESYIYMHPGLGDSPTAAINFLSQAGKLNSTEHLTSYIPIVWNESAQQTLTAKVQGYIVHVKMQFKENPGIIRSVTVNSMNQGFDDKIFKAGYSLTDTKSDASAIGLTLTDNAMPEEHNGLWEADAYLVTAHSDVDVYRSKYHVEVLTANNVKYNMCQYMSFPGQQEATGNTLPMLTNGKMYNLTAQFGEPGICNTIVNTNYKVNSLLGMWNIFGKPYDPCQLVYNVSNYTLPPHVYDIAVTNKTAMMDRMLEGKSAQGTPVFTSQFGTSGMTNNITIQNEPTEVYVTFLSEFAWSQNLLGYYHYQTAPSQPSAQVKNILFANMSRGGHVPFNKDGVAGGNWVNPNDAQNPGQNIGKVAEAPLQEFTTVKLIYTDENGFTSTKFPVGTTIGFFMMQDPKASGIQYDADGNIVQGTYSPRNDGTLLNWTSARYFTDRAWNTNNVSVFVSGDFAKNGTRQQGIAIYGARDNITNTANYAYSAMLFMVSTEKPGSMKTSNTKALNLGTGNQVIDSSKN